MKKATSLILTFLLSLLLLVSPIYAEPNLLQTISISAEQKIETYIKILCSEAFGGRSIGSLGNELTTQWLSGMLEGIGITPYENDDFKMGFMSKCYSFERLEMRVYEKNGGVCSLVSGKDFYIDLSESFDVKLQKDDILLLPIDDTIQEENVDYFFKEVDVFNAIPFNSKRTPQPIQVTREIFQYLSETEIEYIHVVSEVNMKEIEIYNVVGVIPGTNHENAVVLSAHFDHMGMLGESIFEGAIDNASGTAAVLYLAELLSQVSEENPFDFDIIFAFFNDEESGREGSSYLAPIFKDAYANLFNINIDCVGVGGVDNVYSLSNLRDQTLADDIQPYMDKYGLSYNYQPTNLSLSSDGTNFIKNNIPTFSFISDKTGGLIHTTLDTYEKPDFVHIANLCKMISEFIIDNGGNIYEPSKSSSSTPKKVPDNISQKFKDIIEKVKKGEEAYFDDELVSFMRDEFNLYTYSEYLQICEKLSEVKDFNDFRLGFVKTYKNSSNINLVYLKDTPLFELNAIQVTIFNTPLPDGQYNLSPVDGMNGFFIIIPPDNYASIKRFLFIDEGITYVIEVGSLLPVPIFVDILIVHRADTEWNVDTMKELINDLNIEQLIELLKEYDFE